MNRPQDDSPGQPSQTIQSDSPRQHDRATLRSDSSERAPRTTIPGEGRRRPDSVTPSTPCACLLARRPLLACLRGGSTGSFVVAAFSCVTGGILTLNGSSCKEGQPVAMETSFLRARLAHEQAHRHTPERSVHCHGQLTTSKAYALPRPRNRREGQAIAKEVGSLRNKDVSPRRSLHARGTRLARQ